MTDAPAPRREGRRMTDATAPPHVTGRAAA
jgi:hypothetical protein